MRILVATDAWRPQINGVVRTYEYLTEAAAKAGDQISVLSPADFRTFPCPGYPQIQLALPDKTHAHRLIRDARPDAIHIATEGPVGWMARSFCRRHGLPYTTAFHTRFPEYLQSRFWIPAPLTYAIQRYFHNNSAGMMVATESLRAELTQRGFTKSMPWARGVDTEIFRPRAIRRFGKAPVFIFVGRVALEKNIDAFLSMPVDGTKAVIGDGPERAALQRNFPDAIFTGEQTGETLAESYASADVFVFPSRTDTYGIVLLEAMASGLPVAAYPVTGPRDVIVDGTTGVLGEDLATAARAALALDRTTVRAHALNHSWSKAYQQFVSNIRAAHRNDGPTRTCPSLSGSVTV